MTKQINSPTNIEVFLAVFFTLLILTAAQTATAGKLGDTSSIVNDSSDDDEDDDSSCWLLCGLFRHKDDHVVIQKEPQPYTDVDRSYLKYPYANKSASLVVVRTRRYSADHWLESEETSPTTATVTQKKFALMLQGDYHYDWDNVHVAMLKTRVLTSTTLGFDLRWSSWMEPVETNSLDTAHQAELGIHFNATPTEKMILRIGANGQLMNWSTSDTITPGIGAFLGFDFFPRRPFVLSGELLVGALGKSVYGRLETTVGVIVGPVELNIGYRVQLFVNTEDTNTIDYNGFTGGLRFWF